MLADEPDPGRRVRPSIGAQALPQVVDQKLGGFTALAKHGEQLLLGELFREVVLAAVVRRSPGQRVR
jgi:hypothetical protein